MYKYLTKGRDLKSASTSLRGKTNGYGLASNTTIPENPVSFTVTASIKPRIVTKGAINVTPPEEISPTLPKAIDFKPVTPKIKSPKVEPIDLPDVDVPGTGNGDGEWINQTGGVAPLHQQNLQGGVMNVTATGETFNLETKNVDMTGESGAHTLNPHGVQNLNWTGLGGGQFAAMKLVGGQEINIDDVTINYTGTGSNNFRKWLFHTDGHNDNGDSTWNINAGTKINMDGKNLVMYSSQYHGSGNYNVVMTNGGTITTSSTGSSNYVWLPITDGNWGGFRMMVFENRGKILLNGTKDGISYFGSEGDGSAGGISFINDGTIE